jgi:integrase
MAARAAAVAWADNEEQRLRAEKDQGQNAVGEDITRLTPKVVSTTSVFLIKKSTTQRFLRLTHGGKIRDAAALPDYGWHDLRHSCASFLARRGASLLEIGSVLGHKSANMTVRYAHLTPGQPVKGRIELDALLAASRLNKRRAWPFA